ncbi:MAG: hypothetical protein WAM14_01355 [Candidatus Nitrosopolaris sp.]
MKPTSTLRDLGDIEPFCRLEDTRDEGKCIGNLLHVNPWMQQDVIAIYRQYWDLKHMYELGQIYDEGQYDLHKLLRLHKIVKGLGMEEHDIINVLELAKNNQLEYLQWKVEYLRNDIEVLEVQKTKSTNDILKLNKIVDEFEGTLARKRGEVNQEPGRYDNIENLYPIAYQEPDTSSYSIRLSYSQMNDHRWPWQ